MLIDRTMDGYLYEVKAFAAKNGMIDQLQKVLDYWDTYADLDENGKKNDVPQTKCEIFKDWAPYSFRFCVYHRKSKERYTADLKAEVEAMRDKYPDCTLAQHNMWAKDNIPEWRFWFNGGIIYHGPHDNGGDGGAPTFSVNNSDVRHGWTSNT